MEYILDRRVFTDKSTTGVFLGDMGVEEFVTLEDVDRGLQDTMSVEEIAAAKVYGKTAIPYGTYEMAITFSPKFQIETPILLDVKGFEHIRIHSGATAEHTEGCILTGESAGADIIYEGRKAFGIFMPRFREVLARERCFVRITKYHTRLGPVAEKILSGDLPKLTRESILRVKE